MALQTPIREPGSLEEPREEQHERFLVEGRPIEDRGFEAVETIAAAACGLAVGAALGGPIGAAIGVVVGGGAGLAAGEALERAVGPAAETTDADPNDQ